MSIDQKAGYYDAGGIETIEIIRAKLTPDQFRGYCLGNAIKYLCRANFKNDDGGSRDVEKAHTYTGLMANPPDNEASMSWTGAGSYMPDPDILAKAAYKAFRTETCKRWEKALERTAPWEGLGESEKETWQNVVNAILQQI